LGSLLGTGSFIAFFGRDLNFHACHLISIFGLSYLTHPQTKIEMAEEPVALIFQDQLKLVKGFTEYFMKLINQKSGSFHVALSGGSTPKIWFDYLAKNHTSDIPWEKVHLYWGDERCVPPDDPESNFGMTKKHLLDKITIPDKNIHRIQGELKPKEAATLFEKELMKNIGENPVFDLIILGMGDDGHTASVFPHEIKLWDSAALCIVATHPTSGQNRISISGKVINNASALAFLVTGKNKEERVVEIFNQEPNAAYYPASLVKPENGLLHWFLDREAANLLES
jgi:6-phosphogluconolactonase